MKVTIFLNILAVSLTFACVNALDCYWDEWQCGDECISRYGDCNGSCKPWFMKCNSSTWQTSCWHYSAICDGRVDCEDGSDEENCPQDCGEIRPTLKGYFGSKLGTVDCDGIKTCAGEPCNNKCLSEYEKFCDGECISRSKPCNGKCEFDAESRYNYPVFCEEENLCKRETDPCGGKCLNSSLPILSFDSLALEPICITSEATEFCLPEGPIVGQARYMCNGICIPVYIPCNNTCLDNILWRTNRREELFGPVQCQDFKKEYFSEDRIWFLKNLIEFQGYCLPGGMLCNGTCSIDPRRPLKSDRRRGEECVEACHKTREWPCNGTCIDQDKACGNSCKFNHFRCKSGKCLKNYYVCDGDDRSWNDCEDGEDEKDCPDNCFPKDDSDLSERILIDGNGTKVCKAELKKAEEDCSGKIFCDENKVCIALHKINNGERDCKDGSDEEVIIRKVTKLEGVEYRSEYQNQEEYPIEDRVVYYWSYENHLEYFLWICDGKVQNISSHCHGECNSERRWKLCQGENGTGFCAPDEEMCPNTTEGSRGIVINSSGKECKYRTRWICDGKVVCGEQPCNSSGPLECPKYFYLCGSECKPDFVSCDGKCLNDGFLCERQRYNITVYYQGSIQSLRRTTFTAIVSKRVTPRPRGWDVDYLNLMIQTCFANREGEQEKCCLPLRFQCDGSIDCWNGENTDEDDCNDCRVGLGMCQDQKMCLSKKCDGECQDGLLGCGYGGAGVDCAPSYGGFSKSESSNVDCMDWTRRQAGLPEIFASCTDYGCGQPHLLSHCTGYIYGPCEDDN